ncbi:MAG: four helix bundle protein [Odoribacter splanchnicus]
MKEDNTIKVKSLNFAIRIVKLYQHLYEEKGEWVMSRQLLRCGTSIGANVREAEHAQSSADFVNKNSIALKEANETEYWLILLHETDFLTDKEFDSIIADCIELNKILVSIVKTSKQNFKNS